jgi:hypothetical protein
MDSGQCWNRCCVSALPGGSGVLESTTRRLHRDSLCAADGTPAPRPGDRRPRLRPRQVPPRTVAPRRQAGDARRAAEHGSGLGRVRWVVERTFAWLHNFRRLASAGNALDMRGSGNGERRQVPLTLAKRNSRTVLGTFRDSISAWLSEADLRCLWLPVLGGRALVLGRREETASIPGDRRFASGRKGLARAVLRQG